MVISTKKKSRCGNIFLLVLFYFILFYFILLVLYLYRCLVAAALAQIEEDNAILVSLLMYFLHYIAKCKTIENREIRAHTAQMIIGGKQQLLVAIATVESHAQVMRMFGFVRFAANFLLITLFYFLLVSCSQYASYSLKFAISGFGEVWFDCVFAEIK